MGDIGVTSRVIKGVIWGVTWGVTLWGDMGVTSGVKHNCNSITKCI